MSDWKPILDAIIGSRHGGQTDTLVPRLRDLDTRHPRVAEIQYQLAWTLDTLDRPADALPHYEQALALGLSDPGEHIGALIGLANCQRLTGAPARAVSTLETARLQFPDNPELLPWLALALHDAARPADALRELLELLLDTTEAPELMAQQRALRHHAARLK
ncbi:tetratricopeptide repeat protein [Geminisphaera colitermitum]|uniref:tetratricopeptide repeat protein n=1 Tax=Geminisphaera colitermitum TaxID=1148786 RepID=UPI000158CA6A|nr:tetratricopeptide repeat protein [Geminisphaera colitermitum]